MRDDERGVEGRSFLDGGGEATRLILARDWSSHPLGPPERWSADLRATLSLVLNSPESMILAWGPELHFFFNEAYFPLLGPRLPWAMGERFDKVWADGWAQARPIIDAAFAGRKQRFVDLPWKLDTDRGAADTWWTFSYSRVLDADGAVAGLFIFTNETTARVLGDAALREQQERLRLVVNSARTHAILTTDPAGTITSWSPGAEAILGWLADEAVGRSFSLIFTPEDLAAGVDRQELQKAAREGEAADERWHLTKSGARVYLSGATHPLVHDASGNASGFLKIARDETARHRVTSQMELEIEHQRLSLQQMPGFVALLSGPEHVYRYVNNAYVAIAGARAFLGRGVRDVFPELAGQGFHELLDGVFTTGDPFSARAMPIRFAGETDERFIDFLYQPIRNGAGSITGIFVGGYDVTERVRAERGLAHANATLEERVVRALQEQAAIEEALRQSQKMEAVGQLTGGIAHDFNNLLAGISGSLELIQRRIEQGRATDLERYATVAQEATRRAASLTHRLLAFSRRQTLAPKPTDVNRLVSGMEELIRRTVGPTIRIEIDQAVAPWPALVDAPQLESALLNLCINARDAMPDGGTIKIETANLALDEPAARAHDLSAGEYLALSVADTGTGMPPDVVARAFEPFFTTKPIGEGTGLGLSMVYGFARQSGGQIRIVSAVGVGTTVLIYLPRDGGEVEDDEASAQAPSEAAVTSGKVVFVVDDEPSMRLLLADVLRELGCATIEAADSAAGLKVLESGTPIDLLITDIGLPGGMNGRQMAEAAKVTRPKLKVLFITGYAESAAFGEGWLAAGFDVLTKPFPVNALTARVRAMLLSD